MLFAAIPLHIVALAYADLTLLSVNSSVGIVANVIISTSFLGERFNPRYDIPGLTLIAIGCTMIVLLSNKEKPLGDSTNIMEQITSIQSMCFFALAFIVISLAKVQVNGEPFKMLR